MRQEAFRQASEQLLSPSVWTGLDLDGDGDGEHNNLALGVDTNSKKAINEIQPTDL